MRIKRAGTSRNLNKPPIESRSRRPGFSKKLTDSRFKLLNWLGLALVHYRPGHPDEARQCLDKGIQWLEREGPPSPERPAQLMPQDWVEAQLLRREAEETVEIKRSP